ncbi:MAG: LysM domain-containing protein [Pseudomonadota bacterium]
MAPGDTLSGIAAAAGTTVEALAGANETAPVFVTDTLMQFRAGDLEGAATVPPGTSGIYLERDNPEYMNPDADRALGAGDAATELSTLYNLLSFRLSDTADFAGSGEGLPAGPTNEDARASNDPGADTDAAADPDEDRYWRYRRAARISLLAKHNPVPASPALPDARQNPYAGIRAGATVSFSLALQDIYGNRVTPATALQPVTAPVGYTDPLIAPGRWPGSTGAYRFAGDAAAPRLVLDWAFDPSRYTPMPGQAPGAAKASARVDLEQYIRIYYQVAMPGTRFALGTTLGAVDPLDAALRLDFAGFAYQAYAFLGAVAAASPVAVSQGSAPNDTLDGIARAQSTTPGEILAANPDARADALFAAGQSLRIPKLVVALPDDTLEAMAARAGMDISGLAAAIAEHSPNARLGAGTVINAAERPYQVPPDPFLTAATIAADEAVSLTGLQGADTAPLVPGLIEANTGALLEGGAVLTLNGVSLAVAAGGETLAAFVIRFQDREPSATAVDLVVANRMLAGLFAPEQELGLPNYVVAGGDTLAGVAEALAPRAGGIVALLTANATVPAFFPTAEALVVGFDEVAIPSGRSVHEIAEDYGSSLETLGAANGALALAGGASVVLPYRLRVAGEAPSFYRAASAMRFADVVAAYPGWSMPALGDLNAGLAGLFNPETAITLAGTTVTPTLEDSFQSLAAAFDLTLDAFANAVAGLDALVRPGAVIAAPAIESADAETLGNAAARIGTDPGTLGATNAALYGLLQPGQDAVLGTDIVVIGAGATLGTVADAFNVLRLQRGQAASVDAATVARANTGLRLMATTLFPPVRPLQIGTAVTPAYQTAIWPVKATLTMTRPIDLVDPEFADVEQVFSIETALAPQPLADTPEDALAGPDAVDPATPRSLKVFADVFEGVFPGLKLATGNDRATRGDPARWACGQSDTAEGGIRTAEREAGKDTEARQLWAVNLGTQGPPSARFGFTVNGAATACYALPPLSTDLWQATDVDLPKFVPGRGIEGTVTLSFSGVDIDAWAGRFYAMLDRLLSPAYAAAIHRLDGATLAGLVGVKGRIASALKRRVAPIIEAPDALDDPATATDEAAEALYQQLLTELSAAYTVDAIVQVPFDVTSSCSNPATAARLSGKPIGRSVTLTEGAAASLDALATELDVAPAYLAEMVSAQRFVLGDGITLGFDSARFETTRSTTIGDVAVAFGVTPADLPGRLEVVTPDATLFRVGATLTLVALSHMLAEGDSFAGIAGGLDITVEQLVAANAKRTGVFQTGSTLFVPSGSGTVTVEAGDTLADLGTRLGFGTLQAFADALWAGDIEDANRYTLQPDTTLRVLRITPVYSFTTGKVALSNGRQRATFLLDVKDLAANRALLLDLDYTVTELEYDIVERQETVGDYQDSSWLSFVIPLASTPSAALPNDSRVGQVAIPLPLRAYPGLATVSRQTADGLEDANKAALFDWTYGLEMRRQTAAQDAMTLDVRYNVGAADALVSRRALAESPELARALAAFSVAEAALEADLPALGDPAAASGAQAAAKAALGAFATFADAIAAAFEVPAAFLAGSEDGDAYLYDLEPVVSDERRDSFGYLMLRSVSGKPDFVLAAPESMTAALVAALDARTVPPELRSLFADAGFPLSGSPRVFAEMLGSAWRIVDNATVETYALFLDPTDQASRVVATRRYLWPQLFDTSGGGEPAPLERRQIGDALLIPYDRPVSTAIALSFGFEQLDLVTKQNGWSGIGVTRNARLLPKRTTNPDFVYRTREAMFPSKVTPYVLRSERVDLRDFASGTGTDPSLTEALSGFFNALFRQVINAASVTALDMGAAGAGRFVKVAARYGYDIAVPAGGAAPFGAYFPLVLVPEYRFEIPGDAMPDAGSFVTRFAKAVEDARAAAGAPAETGLFQIEVTVYSTDDRGTDTPVAGQPILSLTNLVYALPAGAPRP